MTSDPLPSPPARLAVLVSGSGSNLQALLDRFNSAAAAVARVELVLASRAGCGALDRARAARVARAVLPGGSDEETSLTALLASHRVDLVVLAGYLRLVPATVVRRYRGRIVNVHPALLPAFGGRGMYGEHVHRAVLASGARVSGATVHRVDERYDSGDILAQWPVPVLPGDTPERLGARVLAVEHRLLPLVVEEMVRPKPTRAAPACTAFSCSDATPTARQLGRLLAIEPPALSDARAP
jgi:formyltetrahydrofolate-dependent phosphoribosylglycinamide formyltransferase